jgi:hypothetical protein
LCRAPLDGEEREERSYPCAQCHEHRRRAEPVLRRLDQRVRRAAEAGHCEHRSSDVEGAGDRRVTAFGDVTACRPDHERAEREVDEEDRAPAHRVHQVAAEQRTDGRGNASQARPRADRSRPVLRAEGRFDDRQAAGGEQRAADPLEHPRSDEHLEVRRRCAQRRRAGEPHDADQKDAPAAIPVAERPSEQDERRQGQEVAVDRPLQAGDVGVEVSSELGQCDVHHRGLEEDDPGPQHRERQDPSAGSRR